MKELNPEYFGKRRRQQILCFTEFTFSEDNLFPNEDKMSVTVLTVKRLNQFQFTGYIFNSKDLNRLQQPSKLGRMVHQHLLILKTQRQISKERSVEKDKACQFSVYNLTELIGKTDNWR